MEVISKPTFNKEVTRCPAHIQEGVKEIISLLKTAENMQSSGIDYKKCEGSKEGEKYYRIRVGDWRIGAELIQPQIILITILTRGQIYKKFPPR